MTREEIIAKLSTIKVCVVNITYTYDIGLLFQVLTKRGVYTEDGYNVGMWPCVKLNINNDVRDLHNRLNGGESFSDDQLIEYDFIKELCTFRDIHGYSIVGGKTLQLALSEIRKQLSVLDCSGDYVYAYISLYEWDIDVSLFPSYEKLQEYFIGKWSDLVDEWEYMEDKELEQWYEEAANEDWDCLPYEEVSLQPKGTVE